jgi:hypothetical protein
MEVAEQAEQLGLYPCLFGYRQEFILSTRYEFVSGGKSLLTCYRIC